MESPDASSWAPQSPDLSGYHSSDLHQDPMHPQHQSHRGPILHSAPYPPPTLSPYNQSQVKSQYAPRSVKREREPRDEDGEYHPDASLSAVSSEKPSRARKVKMEENGMAEASTGGGRLAGTEGIEVKTKFPVARIKRIMQADDDVGKVAQVTPVVVSKALELFMISLVTKAAAEAKLRSSKRVTAVHLKQAVSKDQQFDFLCDIVSKVADAPAPAEKSEDNGMEGETKKRKGGGRKKRKTEDDDF